MKWAHTALLAQELDEEVVGQILQKLTHPVELNRREEHDEQGNHQESTELGATRVPSSDQDCEDELMESVVDGKGVAEEGKNLENQEVKTPRRQGDPLYDPLSELYPHEPERIDPNALAKVKCKRHDDWIAHCGCKLDESQMMGVLFKPSIEDRDPPLDYGYVLVEEPCEEDSGDLNQVDIK